MRSKKIAISVPADVIEEVDDAAKYRYLTRSAFITDVLRRVARAKRDADITKRINELFSDPEIAAEQTRTARDYRAISAKIGTEW
jgi:metal-responsive CopG/Arc/MetJ family transcriptional regulator